MPAPAIRTFTFSDNFWTSDPDFQSLLEDLKKGQITSLTLTGSPIRTYCLEKLRDAIKNSRNLFSFCIDSKDTITTQASNIIAEIQEAVSANIQRFNQTFLQESEYPCKELTIFSRPSQARVTPRIPNDLLLHIFKNLDPKHWRFFSEASKALFFLLLNSEVHWRDTRVNSQANLTFAQCLYTHQIMNFGFFKGAENIRALNDEKRNPKLAEIKTLHSLIESQNATIEKNEKYLREQCSLQLKAAGSWITIELMGWGVSMCGVTSSCSSWNLPMIMFTYGWGACIVISISSSIVLSEVAKCFTRDDLEILAIKVDINKQIYRELLREYRELNGDQSLLPPAPWLENNEIQHRAPNQINPDDHENPEAAPLLKPPPQARMGS